MTRSGSQPGRPPSRLARRRFGPWVRVGLWALRVVVVIMIAMTIYVFVRSLA